MASPYCRNLAYTYSWLFLRVLLEKYKEQAYFTRGFSPGIFFVKICDYFSRIF